MEKTITLRHVSKIYRLYDRPADRLKEILGRKRQGGYREFCALRDLTLSVEKGTTLGIIGRNGAGKSTLLKLLMGITDPTEGEIRLAGRVSALLELGAGFNPDFTGRQNIFLSGAVMRIPRAEMAARAETIMAFAEIGEFIDQPVKTFSSGMFVRLAFAVAVHTDPDILIVDEALAVGDLRFQLKCMEKFREFQKKGKTILFVSHDLHAVKRFCGRCIWLDRGALVMDGETDLVADRYADFLKGPAVLTAGEAGQPGGEDRTGEADDLAALERLAAETAGGIETAGILRVRLLGEDRREITEVAHGQQLTVSVDYVVRDETLAGPVLGVAVHSCSHTYICGLNTLLDGRSIPWQRGLNHFELVYDSFSLAGGSYYLDVALEDSTATVNLDYRAGAVSFFVKMGYIGEGVVILKHRWRRGPESTAAVCGGPASLPPGMGGTGYAQSE